MYERQKWPPCESLPELPRGEMLEKCDFSHCHLRGVKGDRENKKEREKMGGLHKKRRIDGSLSRVGLIISLHLGLKGFVGSEVQPRWSAEDCIWLNCAVVFYSKQWDLDKACGTPRCEQLLLTRQDRRR